MRMKVGMRFIGHRPCLLVQIYSPWLAREVRPKHLVVGIVMYNFILIPSTLCTLRQDNLPSYNSYLLSTPLRPSLIIMTIPLST